MSTTKLGILLIRTIAKPIASSIKVGGKLFLWYFTYTMGRRFSAALMEYSKRHERFREICINVAQTTHRLEMQLKLRLLNLPEEKIRPLNDAKAIEAGANFLGEAIIFGIAGSLIIWEQTRSYKHTKERNNHVDETLHKLESEVAELRSDLKNNRTFQEQLQSHLVQAREDNEKLTKILDHVLNKIEPNRNSTNGDDVGINSRSGSSWDNSLGGISNRHREQFHHYSNGPS
ncbi:5619_t:CDS:2 [Ambispora gerdemannii]|uniref:5619_t:CDS:1 n=1 Tax=Ambispora gerdemannii TaxID=144530 RepID=A0A9N9F9M0_9GLOM|nr:5619_t:CDS:2 [Ambispora gerdemannii]